MNLLNEWLETDGLGGFSSGTETLIPTRRYHALLIVSKKPPTHRFCLLNSVEVLVEGADKYLPLVALPFGPSSQAHAAVELQEFKNDLWPTWLFRVSEESLIKHELFMAKDKPLVALSWKNEGTEPVILTVRPLLTVRDYHSLHNQNEHFQFISHTVGELTTWDPYPGTPELSCLTNGLFTESPEWRSRVSYEADKDRGYEHQEDYASPGDFRFQLAPNEEAAMIFLGNVPGEIGDLAVKGASEALSYLRDLEASRRKRFSRVLERAGDTFIVKRDNGKSIIAGYPWFTDWGRDTFISIRGLCIATKRFQEAQDILLLWKGSISQGMLPNLFPDQGSSPLYNSVDSALWYVIAAYEFIEKAKPHSSITTALFEAIESILGGYTAGTRYKIKADRDGLLACGSQDVQLTWMDAKWGDNVFTPRAGKPVEVQALWLNALRIGANISDKWSGLSDAAFETFEKRFWNEAKQCLYDVVDVDHKEGALDDQVRPNQILAVGGLPFQIISEKRARSVVDVVEAELLTPGGLRTLSPSSPDYRPHYDGGQFERDSAYHQGTAWFWLMGPFIEAWVRVRGNTQEAKTLAKEKFLEPLLSYSSAGHLPEISDGDAPYNWRGSPFQAWSVAEAIRVSHLLGC